VHIGNAPPRLSDIAAILQQGDVLTHIYNDKPGNNLFTCLPSIRVAIVRGVYLDVGHGTASFSFDIAKRALKEQIPSHSVSTDIYNHNRINGPVYDLATTMNKFLAMGYPLAEIIACVTENPAK